jgi:DNA polymerase I-like protein with 3'-5' exonuclease and polymerase domains
MNNLFDWSTAEKNIKPVSRPRPPVPPTNWKRPSYFPDLARAKAIAIDLETWDPELLEAGPGWARGKGHILGISVATDCGFKGYFPMRHEGDQNFDPEQVLAWARVELTRPHQPKIGLNLTYDIGWLQEEGVHVKGICYDCGFAEALIDNSAPQNLEALGQKYLNTGKDSNAMYQWLADAFGGLPNGSQRANMYRCPVELVGPYAESDSVLPLAIIQKQWPILQREGLMDVFLMECRLMPLMIAMRFTGVRVDLNKANVVRDELGGHIRERLLGLRAQCGFPINPNSPTDLAKAFDKFGYAYDLTPTGQPSFTSKFLADSKNALATELVGVRELIKMKSTFIEGYILNKNINGRLHGQFKQLKSDKGGTGSGRFSSSDPNLQNIPIRTKLGAVIRSCFVPEQGETWKGLDLSSIEYRILAHFAVGRGADEVRAAFMADPFLDFHQLVCDMINNLTGVGISRKSTKTINFGLLYGMGLTKLAASLGLEDATAKNLIDSYFDASPYVSATLEHYANQASRDGFVATFMGRRSRFETFVPARRGGRALMPLPYEAAVEKWGTNVQRVGLHKAVNRVLQGSAADCLKSSMLKFWDAGLHDVMPMLLTVHDEVGFSYNGSKIHQEALLEARHQMENPFPGLKVPLLSSCDSGPNWGEVDELPYTDILGMCA